MGSILGFRRDADCERERELGERSEIVIFPRKSATSVVDTWQAINRSRERDKRELSDG